MPCIHTARRQRGQGRRAQALHRRGASVRSPRPPRYGLSFADFMAAADGYCRSRWALVDEPTNRLRKARIETRAALLRWARENFPEQYRRYHYRHDVTGKEATERLWADFLRWRDLRELFGL
jgi:hypothetical protein